MAIPKRNKEMTPLKEAIERLLKVYKISDKMDEITLRKEWEELMGKAISNKTKRLKSNATKKQTWESKKNKSLTLNATKT